MRLHDFGWQALAGDGAAENFFNEFHAPHSRFRRRLASLTRKIKLTHYPRGFREAGVTRPGSPSNYVRAALR